MTAHPLLPDPAVLTLDSLTIQNGIILFAARAVAPGAACPCCGWLSERLHSRYPRTLLDLPWQGNAVRIALSVRKFFCDNRQCEQRIFAERLPAVAKLYARKTARLAEALRELAYLAGGEAAARIARTFGLRVSPDALLGSLRQSPLPTSALSRATPRVLGVDDFAFLRGQRYGTILIDQEKRCPVDLLPDREGATLERWLAAHPAVEIVTRDRGTTYAEALSRAAPDAVQVADRFHLLQNLTEAFGDWLAGRMPQLRKALLPEDLPPPVSRQIARVERRRHESRQRRLDSYEQVRCLRAQGLNAAHIAAAAGVCPDTVYTYLNAPAFPERTPLAPKPSPLDPFVPYLRQRWEQGCHNALKLWRELKERGFTGGATGVRDLVRPWRTAFPAQGVPTVSLPRPKALMWLLTGPEGKWDEQQKPLLEKLLCLCPEVMKARDLVRSFFDLSRRRAGQEELEAWLWQAKDSGLDKFVTFARGVERDRAAVVAGLSQPWSNGPVEGQVSRLKFLKRQMYGRARFELLRARVLPFPAAVSTAAAAA